MNDLEWFYSSVAQSAAVIAAVVGGFLTAAVMNLASKRAGFREAIDQANIRLALFKRQSSDATREAWRLKTRYMVFRYLDYVVHTGLYRNDPKSARDRLRADHIPYEYFAEEWDVVSKQIKDECDWFAKESENESMEWSNLDGWSEGQRHDTRGHDLRVLETAFRLKLYHQSDLSVRKSMNVDLQNPAPYLEEGPGTYPDVDALFHSAAEKTRQYEMLESEMEHLRLEEALMGKMPWSVWIGFVMLIGVLITGIFIPLMATPGKLWTMAWFAFGIAGVCVYVGLLLRTK